LGCFDHGIRSMCNNDSIIRTLGNGLKNYLTIGIGQGQTVFPHQLLNLKSRRYIGFAQDLTDHRVSNFELAFGIKIHLINRSTCRKNGNHLFGIWGIFL